MFVFRCWSNIIFSFVAMLIMIDWLSFFLVAQFSCIFFDTQIFFLLFYLCQVWGFILALASSLLFEWAHLRSTVLSFSDFIFYLAWEMNHGWSQHAVIKPFLRSRDFFIFLTAATWPFLLWEDSTSWVLNFHVNFFLWCAQV